MRMRNVLVSVGLCTLLTALIPAVALAGGGNAGTGKAPGAQAGRKHKIRSEKKVNKINPTSEKLPEEVKRPVGTIPMAAGSPFSVGVDAGGATKDLCGGNNCSNLWFICGAYCTDVVQIRMCVAAPSCWYSCPLSYCQKGDI